MPGKKASTKADFPENIFNGAVILWQPFLFTADLKIPRSGEIQNNGHPKTFIISITAN
jgi:hypothetical protein